MKKQHFIIYRNEHTESRNGQSEVVRAVRVEEILADGKRRTMYSNVHFYNSDFPPVMRELADKAVPKTTERLPGALEGRLPDGTWLLASSRL